MKNASKIAAVRKLTDEETKHAVGGVNPIVVRLAAKAVIFLADEAINNPINVGGLLEAARQKVKK